MSAIAGTMGELALAPERVKRGSLHGNPDLARRTRSASNLTIDIPAVSDLDYRDDEHGILNLVDDPVVALPYPVVIPSREFDATHGSGIDLERGNLFGDPTEIRVRDSLNILL